MPMPPNELLIWASLSSPVVVVGNVVDGQCCRPRGRRGRGGKRVQRRVSRPQTMLNFRTEEGGLTGRKGNSSEIEGWKEMLAEEASHGFVLCALERFNFKSYRDNCHTILFGGKSCLMIPLVHNHRCANRFQACAQRSKAPTPEIALLRAKRRVLGDRRSHTEQPVPTEPPHTHTIHTQIYTSQNLLSFSSISP